MYTPLVPLSRRIAAFTMVELAMCIAVVAVAMVAIIGVLPSGLTTQQVNREETIINQDATVLMEAIRNGSWLTDDITNYVDYVVVERHPLRSDHSDSTFTNGFVGVWYANAKVPSPATKLTAPWDVVGLLSLPKYDGISAFDAYYDSKAQPQGFTNSVVAQFRAFSGSITEKPLVSSNDVPVAGAYDRSFKYMVRVEISPVRASPTNATTSTSVTNSFAVNNAFEQALRHSLYDVSLTFQWPVFGTEVPARVGNNSRTIRTQVQGRLVPFYFSGSTTPYTLTGSKVVPRNFVTTAASANVKFPQ